MINSTLTKNHRQMQGNVISNKTYAYIHKPIKHNNRWIRTHYIPGTLLNALPASSHLIVREILWGVIVMKKLRHKELKKVAQCYIVLLILDSIPNLPDFIGPHWIMLPPQCNVAYQSKIDMYKTWGEWSTLQMTIWN